MYVSLVTDFSIFFSKKHKNRHSLKFNKQRINYSNSKWLELIKLCYSPNNDLSGRICEYMYGVLNEFILNLKCKLSKVWIVDYLCNVYVVSMEINIDNQSAINTSKFTHRLCPTPFYLNFCSMQISHLTSAINLLTKLLWIQSMSYSSVQTVQPNTINYTIKLMWRCFQSLTHSRTHICCGIEQASMRANKPRQSIQSHKILPRTDFH